MGEEEIFQGEGDYQFNIYRYMRAHKRVRLVSPSRGPV
jgi:hypothetical protein